MSNINNTPFLTTEEKIEAHLKRYRDEYILLGVGVAIGLTLNGFRKKPKVDTIAVVTQWVNDLADQGLNVYTLTNEQKALWESTWSYMLHGAKQFGMTPSEAMGSLARHQTRVVELGLSVS